MTTHKQNDTHKKQNHSVEDLPYVDSALKSTHPDSLYTLGSLFGMSPAPATKCRVLSLAASDGANLIGMAFDLPGSKFVGITHSEQDLALANKKIKALNLTNIEMKCMDVLAINKDIGEFDYIIAQGIYSWVDEERRKKILSLCRELLVVHGIAYVNYNAYPGWHMHQALRDMMQYHSQDEKNSRSMVKKAREFTQLLTKAAAKTDHFYGVMMQHELEMINGWRDDYLRHDTLGAINQPFYFHEFVEAAAKEKLQFMSDAIFHSMVPGKLPEEAAELFHSLGSDKIAKEQYMDFFYNRMFKQTLLIHDDVRLGSHLYIEALKQFYYASPILPVSSIPDIQTDKVKTFKSIDGVAISASDPVMKALLQYLSSQYPVPRDFASIVSNLKTILGSDYQYVAKGGKLMEFEKAVLKNLLDGYGIGMLKVFARPISVSAVITDTPTVTELARYEAEHGLIVTNQFHDPVNIDVFSHHLIPHLNGKNSVPDLVTILTGLVKQGKIMLRKGQDDITRDDAIKDILQKRVNTLLKDYARHALLISN